MAGAGFKSWVDGDILTASDVNTYLMQQAVMVFADASARSTAITAPSEGMVTYLTGTDAIEYYDGSSWVGVNDLSAIQNSIMDAKGDLIVATADNTPARLAVGTDGSVLVADSGETAGVKWAAPLASDAAFVSTEQSTTSTSYTDLATSGPAVTVTTGTKALVIVKARLFANDSAQAAYMSTEISGSSSVSAADDYGLVQSSTGTQAPRLNVASAHVYTGLTAGSNTFTAKYRSSNASSAAYFRYREIIVIDLGS